MSIGGMFRGMMSGLSRGAASPSVSKTDYSSLSPSKLSAQLDKDIDILRAYGSKGKSHVSNADESKVRELFQSLRSDSNEMIKNLISKIAQSPLDDVACNNLLKIVVLGNNAAGDLPIGEAVNMDSQKLEEVKTLTNFIIENMSDPEVFMKAFPDSMASFVVEQTGQVGGNSLDKSIAKISGSEKTLYSKPPEIFQPPSPPIVVISKESATPPQGPSQLSTAAQSSPKLATGAEQPVTGLSEDEFGERVMSVVTSDTLKSMSHEIGKALVAGASEAQMDTLNEMIKDRMKSEADTQSSSKLGTFSGLDEFESPRGAEDFDRADRCLSEGEFESFFISVVNADTAKSMHLEIGKALVAGASEDQIKMLTEQLTERVTGEADAKNDIKATAFLEAELSKLGLKTVKIPDDGNCFYDSLTHSFPGMSIQDLKDKFAADVISGEIDVNGFLLEGQSKEEFAGFIKADRMWNDTFGELYVQAICRKIAGDGRPVIIIDATAQTLTQFLSPVEDKSTEKPIVITRHRNHFEATIPDVLTASGASDLSTFTI